MKEIERTGDLADYLTRLPLAKVHLLLDPVQQLTTIDFLENEIKLFLVFEKLDQLYDIWMSLAMVECLDFLEYSGPRMSRNLIDDFHGILQIRVQGRTRLNRGIGPFSKHLSRQFVQIWNTMKSQDYEKEEEEERNTEKKSPSLPLSLNFLPKTLQKFSTKSFPEHSSCRLHFYAIAKNILHNFASSRYQHLSKPFIARGKSFEIDLEDKRGKKKGGGGIL